MLSVKPKVKDLAKKFLLTDSLPMCHAPDLIRHAPVLAEANLMRFLLAVLLLSCLPVQAGDGWSIYNTCPEPPPASCVQDSWLRWVHPYELGDLSGVSKWTHFLIANGHDVDSLCYWTFAWDTGETPTVRPWIMWADEYRGTPIAVLSKKYPTGVSHKVRAWERGSTDCAETAVFLPASHCCGQ